MATYGWGKNSPVEAGLFEQGHRFDFFQAVRLLEQMAPQRAAVGEQEDPDLEVVRFSSRVRLDYPATDVDAVSRAKSNDSPAGMSVNLMSLAGVLGPLPAVYTELLQERLKKKDTAFRDFLDLFNHRLISLFYRARKRFRAALQDRPPDESLYARSLLALIGLGGGALRGRMGIPDRALLRASGILAHRARPMVGLERLAEEHFGVPAKVLPFKGRWFHLEPDGRTAIGTSGFNRTLGQGALLGHRVWVQDAGFELNLGPMSLGQYLDFLPVGESFESACELARFYAGDDLGCDLRLTLAAAEIPRLRLGRAGDSHLGWSARLASSEGGSQKGGRRGKGASRLRLGSAGAVRLGWTSWLRGPGPQPEDAVLILRTHLYRGPEAVWKPDPLEDPFEGDGAGREAVA